MLHMYPEACCTPRPSDLAETLYTGVFFHEHTSRSYIIAYVTPMGKCTVSKHLLPFPIVYQCNPAHPRSFQSTGGGKLEGMVTSRLFRTACACLTMCPFVVCGGERGDSRVFARVSGRFCFSDMCFFFDNTGSTCTHWRWCGTWSRHRQSTYAAGRTR